MSLYHLFPGSTAVAFYCLSLPLVSVPTRGPLVRRSTRLALRLHFRHGIVVPVRGSGRERDLGLSFSLFYGIGQAYTMTDMVVSSNERSRGRFKSDLLLRLRIVSFNF
jgi:hypothetical protein